MILGRVVGELWATRKHAALDGRKLLVIEPYFWYAPAHECGHLVAVDTLDAGVGDDVVVCLGESARRSLGSSSIPVEAAVAAIVDRVELALPAASGEGQHRPLAFVDGRPARSLGGDA